MVESYSTFNFQKIVEHRKTRFTQVPNTCKLTDELLTVQNSGQITSSKHERKSTELFISIYLNLPVRMYYLRGELELDFLIFKI